MKILVLSDSHGRKQKVEDLISSTPHDFIFFLGDGIGDFSKINQNIFKVAGNCDFFSPEAVTRIENISNIKVMLTHGHAFKAKFLIEPMVDYAKQNNCSLLCFGHTHKQKYENISGVTVVNPGAFKNGNYAIITIDNLGNIQVELKSI